MDLAALDELKKLLAAPNLLDSAAKAVSLAGEWRGWTLERQTWYLRVSLSMTQAELSRRSGVSQHRISRIETGADLKLSTLRSLWRALGVEPLILPDAVDFPRAGRRPRRPETRPGTSDLTSTT